MVDLAVVDIDGCLTPGVAQPWNWLALQAVQAHNRRARMGEAVPPVTLCTGRAASYVEVLMQAIGGYLPAIYENGCGLYFPRAFRFVVHPSISQEMLEILAETRRMLSPHVVTPGKGFFHPGKELSLTVFPLPPSSVAELRQLITEVLAAEGIPFEIQASVSCVDITPRGIDKGTGVRWLAEETGIGLREMGGIGDSTSDLQFLDLVGESAAPANAPDEVKAAVGYVSPYNDGEAVIDILRRWAA